MSIGLVTLLLAASMIIILMSGLPIAFGLGSVGLAFTWLLWGYNGLSIVAAGTWGLMQSWVLLAAPFFVFTGLMLERSGIANDLFHMMHLWLGPLRGGLAIGTVLICTLFAAMVGIVAAATVTMALIALPAMLKRGYDKDIALGCIAAGGALGQLIPPSLDFVVFGLLTGTSVGKLFAAGVVPGLLLSFLYIAYIAIRCAFQPHLGPALPPEERGDWGDKLRSIRSVILPILLIAVILGSIFSGIATPTEAAAIGAIGSLVCAALHGRLKWIVVREASYQTLKLSGMVAWVIIGATCFSTLYHGLGASSLMQDLVSNAPGGRWGVLIVMQLSFFVLGMFMDDIPIMMITAPIYMPLVKSLGFDPVWYGVIFLMNMEMGYLSPPFGLVLFFMKSVLPKELGMADVYRSIWPFVGLQAIGLILCMIFPQIVLWLPGRIMQ